MIVRLLLLFALLTACGEGSSDDLVIQFREEGTLPLTALISEGHTPDWVDSLDRLARYYDDR